MGIKMTKTMKTLGKICIFLLMLPLMMAGAVVYVAGCLTKGFAHVFIGEWRQARKEVADIKEIW